MGNNTFKGARQSNIELLRMTAAFGVIIQHYNNPRIGGAIRAVIPGSSNQMILGVLHVAMICAVDLFILISGYFMRDSKKRDFLKPIKLLSMLLVFEFIFFCVQVLLHGEPFDFRVLIGYYTPNYWFIFVYIALYLISPYINLVWSHLTQKNRKILLALSLGLFSVYPIDSEMIGIAIGDNLTGTSTIGLEGAQAGYTIVNFVLMYMIGCALRDLDDQYDRKQPKTSSIAVLLVLNIGILFIWMILEREKFALRPGVLAIPNRYHNPLVISEAVLYFMLFKQLKIKNSRIINSLAAASFPSYLIHINMFRYCGIEQAVRNSPVHMICHILCCTIGIYIVSWLIYTLYTKATDPLFKFIEKKWQSGRIYKID